MKPIAVFEKEEYQKLMETLDLMDYTVEDTDDENDYFNAWNFGITEDDCNFLISSSLT